MHSGVGGRRKINQMASIQKTKINFPACTMQKCSPAFLLDRTSFETVIDLTYRSRLVMNRGPNLHFFFQKKPLQLLL